MAPGSSSRRSTGTKTSDQNKVTARTPSSTGETKEEAKKRRALQAEKRRLAQEKAEEERQKRTRKRKALEETDEAVVNDKDGGEAAPSAERIKSPSKRVRKPTNVNKPFTTTMGSAVSSTEHSSEKTTAPAPKIPNDEKPKLGEKQLKDETPKLPSQSKPVSASTKRSAATTRTSRSTPVRRVVQAVKHSKPTQKVTAATPPRRSVVASSGLTGGAVTTTKPPFGSPLPPSAVKKQRQQQHQQPSRVVAKQDAPLAVGAAPALPTPTTALLPADPPSADVVATAPPVADPPTRAPVDANIQLESTQEHAAVGVSVLTQKNEDNLALPRTTNRKFHDNEDDDEDDNFEDDDDDCEEDGFDFDDDDDDDHNSLRQQALRVIAERRDREYVARMQAQAAAIAQEQRQMESEQREADRRRSRWTRPLSGVFIVCLSSWYIARSFPNGLNLTELFFPHWLPRQIICFHDTGDRFGEVPTQLVPRCENKEADYKDEDGRSVEVHWKLCPTGAVCERGDLLKCPRLYQVHDNHCYLSTESNATLQDLHNLLHEWTVRAYCSGYDDSINQNIAKWADRPFFHYSRLVGELECGYDPSLVMLGNQTVNKNGIEVPLFLLEHDDPDLWMALHPMADMKIPTLCFVGRTFLGLLFLLSALFAMIASASLSAFRQLIIWYYGAFLEAPLYVGLSTFFCVCFASATYSRWVERTEREQRNLEIVQVRGEVHKRLGESDDKAVSVEWLSQDIAWKRYEMSKRGRRNLIKNIWPHVVRDIAEDGRIQKIAKTEDGKRVEYWKWVAPTVSTSFGGRDGRVCFDQ